MEQTVTLPTTRRPSTLGFALCGLFLPASLIAPFVLLFGIAAVLSPAHGMQMDSETGGAIAMIMGVVFLSVGGALWGRALSRATGSGRVGWMALAGAISHVVMTLLAARVLGELEVEVVERGRTDLPIHVVFTLLFVPATFVVAFVMSGALGVALGDARLAIQLAWRGGIAAALAFLVINVLQDLLGRRVGGPNASATMITVMLIGNIGAAMAMSAVVGRRLAAASNVNRKS